MFEVFQNKNKTPKQTKADSSVGRVCLECTPPGLTLHHQTDWVWWYAPVSPALGKDRTGRHPQIHSEREVIEETVF